MSNDTQIAAHMALVRRALKAETFSLHGGPIEQDVLMDEIESSARQLSEQPGFVRVPVEPTPEVERAIINEMDRQESLWRYNPKALYMVALTAARPSPASPTAPTEASEPVGEREAFEIELRKQCFQKPTPEAYDLAWSMWKAKGATHE